MKKIIALALALIMVLSMGTVAFAAGGTGAQGDPWLVENESELAAAVAEGGYIKLMDSFSVVGAIPYTSNGKETASFIIDDGESVYLDMNGKTITATDPNTKQNHSVFYLKGEMTITGNGTITLSSTTNRGWGGMSAIVYNRGGVLTIENGTFTNEGGTDMAFVVDNTGNSYGDATTNINGGTLSSTYIAIRNAMVSKEKNAANGGSYLNITDGSISGDSRAIWAQASSSNVTIPAIGEINISGGNVGLIDTARTTDAVCSTTISGDAVVESIKAEAGEVEIAGGTVTGAITVMNADGSAASMDDIIISDDAVILQATPAGSEVAPGLKVVASSGIDRTVYKVKSYDFTTGTRDFKGASYIDEVKIEKNGDLVIILKDNYKLAEDKAIKGEIVLVNKSDRDDTIEIPVEYTVKNNVHETYGERKPSEAIYVPNDENQIILMDEDGGYVYFEEEMLKGVVKMNKEEKTFLNVIYGGQEETVEAIEEILGEEYLEEAIIEYYEFETRAFKNEVAFSYEAYEDDPHYFYLYNDGKLTKIDATYDDDEDVEAWVWTAIAEGTIIVTDVEIVLADETTKNPDTGANDVVGVAAALAVVSLVAAGAVSLKK